MNFEKLKFPQKDLNYFCENLSQFLGASTIENNQHYSKPVPENKSHDEGQEGVVHKAPEVEMGGNPLGYEYLFTMLKEVVERKIKNPVETFTRLMNFTDGKAKDLIKLLLHC